MNYLDYFEPGGNIRYIERYVTDKPANKEEIPLTTYSGFIPWLISKFKDKRKDNAAKTTDVTPAEISTTSYGNGGSKYVGNVRPNYEQYADTVSAGPHLVVINRKPQS